MKIKPTENGRFGAVARMIVAPIADGAGSISAFKLKLERRFGYPGERRSLVNARCVDGKLQVGATARFADGTDLTSEFVRPCTPKR